ncbi:MAG: hypothetical protein WBB76_08805 [Gaiellaceae bacterium]
MAKKIDPKAKAKRQKVLAVGLGVALLGVLAFQVPRTLKMLHQSNAKASSTTPTTTSAGTTTGTAATSASLASRAGSGGALSDPDVLPTPRSGQLLAFSRFRSKDPFAQQLNLNCGSTSGSTTGGATSCPQTSTSTQTPASTVTAPKKTVPVTITSGAGSSATRAAKPTSAVISVNGNSESVATGAKFPSSNPMFLLVSLTRSSAKIAIAGGSLAGGKQTVTLKKGSPLTLQNTADGTRYVLRLLSTS